ncbi:HEAT repeat domain-containing protein [Leptospira ilyithenensis]|uniref:HEAT repeat domain-containing protein n=1 Tax=Leptospira ilyithenensis TaxID=2484901 RepID=A0A4R9LQ39_9LEPT|nr:HEAT repeat domain-containing protein [Leptospira ilyithenensis]TGN10096.1 HEAT repeat domain-containing protein [Leptospira ilyithenensis]
MHLSKYCFIIIFFLSTFVFQCGEKDQVQPKPVVEDEVEEEIPTAKLLQDLDSDDVFLRSQATIQLGSRQIKESIPKLKKLLIDKEPGVRAGAAIALGDLQERSATQAIVRLLESDKENPKDVYLDALGRLKDPSAGKQIIFLLDSEDPTLRLQTIEALVLIDAKDQGASILKMALKNKNREKDKTYAMALGKLGHKESEDYLLDLTKTLDGSTTLAAAYLALGRIGAKKAVPTLAKALDLSFSKGKENASVSLVQIGDPKTIDLVFPLLESKTEETQMYVTDVLSGIPSLEAGKRALALLNSDKKSTWGNAAKIAGRQKYAPAREKLESLLVLDSTPNRDSFAEALGWIGDKASIPVLRKVLLSGAKEGPYGSAWALGVMGAREAVGDLITATNSSDGKLVSYALEALGSIRDESALPTLIRLLKNRPQMAPQVLSAVSQLQSREARQVIEDATNSNDPNVYRPAMEELARRKDKLSLPVLFEHVNGSEAEKRKLSYYALAAITGEHFRTKKEWNDWRTKTKN